MQAPMAPGPRRPKRAPLPTVSLLVGATFAVLTLVSGFASTMSQALAHDALVMRALGLTVGFAAFMLGNVALKAASGARRVSALILATPLVALALALLVRPALAHHLYDTGRAIFVPWVFGVPAVLALLLSRWRAYR